jgi:hypothetical protein
MFKNCDADTVTISRARRSFSRLGARCTIRDRQSNCARENKVLESQGLLV